MGQLPVTCGLFFSLGHSTIVVVVNVAIAISTDVYDRMQGVGAVGGIVGAAVSASFLFIVGLANSIILYRILRKRHRLKRQGGDAPNGCAATEVEADDGSHHNTLMMKIVGPVVTFVDRPWKMYPVGLLFGFGFDTASSIALLAVSAIAKREPDGQQTNLADIVILPLLFTVGMTLIDSLDSIIMLYSYAGFPEQSFALFERHVEPSDPSLLPGTALATEIPTVEALPRDTPNTTDDTKVDKKHAPAGVVHTHKVDAAAAADDEVQRRRLRVKHNAMSNLSILLTIMSIVVAFSISLITTMGLIGENCTQCQNAADAEDGGGLAGRWWRGWANANENSGYIGAAIVGSFVFVVCSWYGVQFFYRRWNARGRCGELGNSRLVASV